MTAAQQAVYLAVSIDAGTAAVRALGNELKRIDRITANFERRVRETLEAALAVAVQARLIEIIEITVERMGTVGAFARLRWRDLETQEEHEDRI